MCFISIIHMGHLTFSVEIKAKVCKIILIASSHFLIWFVFVLFWSNRVKQITFLHTFLCSAIRWKFYIAPPKLDRNCNYPKVATFFIYEILDQFWKTYGFIFAHINMRHFPLTSWSSVYSNMCLKVPEFNYIF